MYLWGPDAEERRGWQRPLRSVTCLCTYEVLMLKRGEAGRGPGGQWHVYVPMRSWCWREERLAEALEVTVPSASSSHFSSSGFSLHMFLKDRFSASNLHNQLPVKHPEKNNTSRWKTRDPIPPYFFISASVLVCCYSQWWEKLSTLFISYPSSYEVRVQTCIKTRRGIWRFFKYVGR